MKKNIFISAIVAVAAILTTLFTTLSCVGSDEVGVSEIKGGLIIYNAGYKQFAMSTDPAHVAFRLNILMATAKSQGIDYSKITTTMVKVDGESKQLTKVLFGDNIIGYKEPGVWEIYYAMNREVKFDTKREGIVRIDTKNNKLLQELEAGESWSIEPAAYVAHYKSEKTSADFVVKLNNPMLLTANENTEEGYSWSLTSEKVEVFHKDNAGSNRSDWDLDYVVEVFVDEMTYENILNSPFAISGTASGKPVNYNMNFKHIVRSPLLYGKACNTWNIYSGFEHFESEALAATDNKLFPESQVGVKWKKSTADSKCYITPIVSYYGIVLDMFGINLTNYDEVK